MKTSNKILILILILALTLPIAFFGAILNKLKKEQPDYFKALPKIEELKASPK